MIGSSWFVNDTWTQIPTGAGFTQASAMAYGGRLNGLANPDVLYVASGSQIFLRSTAGGTLTATSGQPGGATIVSIALDPNNWQTAFVADATDPGFSDSKTRIYMTTDAGAHWTNVTGNLKNPAGARGAPEVLSVIAGAGQDAVLFGGTQGVLRMLTNTPGLWTKFGAGLPNVFTGSMVYNAADDVLVENTYGRGAWELPSASTVVFLPGVLEIDGDTDFPGENDTIKLVIDASNPALLDVYLNSNTPVDQVPIALLNQINVNGLGGNDTLIVDSSNGLINVPNGINYDGGTGFNTLDLVQTGGTMQTSDVYSPGPNPGEGTDVITGPSGTQTVSFQNLAPVLDLVPAATFTVNGTPANNAISYSRGLIDPVHDGLVTVDNFESIEFANKTNLSINSGLGTDTISINNPNTPTGLTGIGVMGGDPNANDALFVTGVAATVNVDTFGAVISGATGTSGAIPVNYSAVHNLTVSAGSSSTLAIGGSRSYVYTPGTAADGGSVQTDLLPISFSGFGAGTTLAVTGILSSASLVVNGTTGNDVFTVAAASGHVTLTGRTTIAPASIASLTVNGLDGGDTFNVTGPQPYASITLGGGGALAGDVANLTGDGAAVTANLGGTTASVTGGDLGSVSLPGIETLNLNAGSGAITLLGTPGPDAFIVTPTGANTATAQVSGLAPTVNVTTTASLSVNGGGGTDALTVDGTAGSDTISVSGTQVAVNSLLPVNYSSIASLQVNGLAGNNTFNVTSSATVPINIDGGDPASMTPADQLNLNTGPSDTVAFTPGPTSDQGTIRVNSNQPISFAKIVGVTAGGAGAAVIYGTSGNDVVTVVARDSSYNASANGVQDFTVSVNGGPILLFLSTPALTIHALGGDDQIDVKAPAPNGAAWDEAVTVDGGPSSAVGNQLVMAIPGASQATYTPASASSGAFVVNNSNGLVANVAITNIQSFIDDGQSGGEKLTVVGTVAANLFTLQPRSANDAGTLSMDTTLPVAFQNLGTSGQVVVNGNGGADTLLYYGVAANDSFTVASNVLGGQVNLNARVPVITEAIQTLTLQGVAGGDTFTLVPTIAASPYSTLNLQAGNLAAGDQANLTAGPAADVSVSGQVVSQSGNTVAGSGLANINLNGSGNRLIYNGVPGVTENINVMASTTANQGQVSVPGVVLVTFVNVPLIAVNGQLADNDTVTFTGTNNQENYQINLAAAGTATDPVLKLQTTTGTTLLTLQNYTGFQTLNIFGMSGADTFNVFTAPTAPGGGRQIFIDEQLPAGKKKLTAVLNVFYVMPKPKIVHSTSTQDPDAGLVSLDYGTANFLIQFDGIPTVIIRKQ
jgi:hypothetical protein